MTEEHQQPIETTLRAYDVTVLHPVIGCRNDSRSWHLKMWAYRDLFDKRVGQCVRCGCEPRIISPLPWERR